MFQAFTVSAFEIKLLYDKSYNDGEDYDIVVV